MNKKYLKQSLALHAVAAILILVDLPNFWHHDMTLGQSPIIVDLSQVRIDEMTNLPSKAEFGPEDRKATVAEKPKEQFTNDAPPPPPEPQAKEKPEPQAEPQAELFSLTKVLYMTPCALCAKLKSDLFMINVFLMIILIDIFHCKIVISQYCSHSGLKFTSWQT